MKFNELIVQRQSTRNFKNTPVEKNKIVKVLEAARMAPSAVNYQPWHFIVVQKKENLEILYKTYHREWFKTAPAIIVACADHSASWKRSIDGKDSAEIDVAIAVDHLTLQAAELELGTCWVCNFDTERCAEYLKLPLHISPVALIPIGYPAEKTVPRKKRKPIDEIVHWENFNLPALPAVL
jgi:nitroreductase